MLIKGVLVAEILTFREKPGEIVTNCPQSSKAGIFCEKRVFQLFHCCFYIPAQAGIGVIFARSCAGGFWGKIGFFKKFLLVYW